VPDLIALVREPNVICSSTTPTLPYGVHAAAEHLAMTILNHGGSWAVPDDLELVRERIHPATMAAEGPLHELGAIAITNSDSQGMGRIGETLRRTLQLAHVMKSWAADESSDDNDRVLRYLAKCTTEPAIVHGVSNEIGSLSPGRLADVVLWRPAFFGVKPEWVLKGGYPAWGPLGEGNATVERAEPTRYRADWGGLASAAPSISLTFVSGAVGPDLAARLRTRRSLVAIRNVRGLTRASLARNRATAAVEVDAVDGWVTLDDRVLAVEPVSEVPLSRRYLLR
jgi:urease subunit alpha